MFKINKENYLNTNMDFSPQNFFLILKIDIKFNMTIHKLNIIIYLR